MTIHLLALETSSSLCGLALLVRDADGVRILSRSHEGTGDHAERLLPLAQDLLDEAGVARTSLDAVAFGQGPGGFTGLRVACGVAQGMAFALGLPVVPVSSLLAVAAQQAATSGTLHVVLQDARMDEVYAAVFRFPDEGSWQILQEPVLLDVADVPAWVADGVPAWSRTDADPVLVSGDALVQFPLLTPALQQAGYALGTAARATAESVARLALVQFDLGLAVAPDEAMPVYVRDKVAYTIAEREQGRGGNPGAQDQPVSLAPMRDAHLDAVLDIERRVQSWPWSRGNFADSLAAGYHARVALRQGRVVGFALWLAAPDLAQLMLIGVDPDSQGQGVGRQLLAEGERWARSLGLDAVLLEVRVSNLRAERFYRQAGYHEVGRRKNYYPFGQGQREDAVLMRKALSPEAEPAA